MNINEMKKNAREAREFVFGNGGTDVLMGGSDDLFNGSFSHF